MNNNNSNVVHMPSGANLIYRNTGQSSAPENNTPAMGSATVRNYIPNQNAGAYEGWISTGISPMGTPQPQVHQAPAPSCGPCSAGSPSYVPSSVPGQIVNPCTGDVRRMITMPQPGRPKPCGKPGQQEEYLVVRKFSSSSSGTEGSEGGGGGGGGQDNNNGVPPCQMRRGCHREEPVKCYQPSPRRGNCYPCDHQEYDLAYLTSFASFDIGRRSKHDWSYFNDASEFFADDGKVSINKKGLTVVSRAFTKTYPAPTAGAASAAATDFLVQNANDGGQLSSAAAEALSGISAQPSPNGFLDHTKFVAILNSEYKTPECGQLYVEACIAARILNVQSAALGKEGSTVIDSNGDIQYSTFGNAINNPETDLRLGYAALMMVDYETGLCAKVALVNGCIYAVYEMLAYDIEEGLAEDGRRVVFGSAHFLASRDSVRPMHDYVRVGIGYDRQKGLSWYINDVVLHREVRVGFPGKPKDLLYYMPGEARTVQPTCFRCGFGFFTMLDALPPSIDQISPSNRRALVRLTTGKYINPLRPSQEAQFVFENSPVSARTPRTGAVCSIRNFKIAYRC